jgi:1,4-alpha-glucan branching enzyme
MQHWSVLGCGNAMSVCNGVPMLFMGQEVGETIPFAFDSASPALNPQRYSQPPGKDNNNSRVLSWFCQLMGLRNDPNQGLQGDYNYQTVAVGHRTVAFACGLQQSLFVVVTFGTADQQQDSSWLGLPPQGEYKEIFNSSWPVFQVEFESSIARMIAQGRSFFPSTSPCSASSLQRYE